MKRIIILMLFIPFVITAKLKKKYNGKSKRNYVYNHHKGKHDGKYILGKGSSHKGGRYYSVKTGKHYGKHKN